jgi:hypothetical protein
VTGREQEDHDAGLDAGRSPDTSPGQGESEAPATTRVVPDDQWVAYAASVAHDYSAAHQRAVSLESALGIACQRLESWKAGELSAESALAHICGALGVAAPTAPPSCASCGEARDDVDEYTGVPGPVCKPCHQEWATGQRESPQW